MLVRCLVVAHTNNIAMLCCVLILFMHIVTIIITLFVFCELEWPIGAHSRSFLHEHINAMTCK